MKVALPIFHGRLSPVFDVARQLLVVEMLDGVETERWEEPLPCANDARRAAWVKGHGVEVLICQAVSHCLEAQLASMGIQVISQTCGNVEEVLAAYRTGRLDEETFRMPGCRGRRRRRCGAQMEEAERKVNDEDRSDIPRH